MLYFCIFCEFSWLYLYNFVKNWIICEHESIFGNFLWNFEIFSVPITIRPKMVPKMIAWASCICLETILDESGAQYLYFLWNHCIFCELFEIASKLTIIHNWLDSLSHIYRSGDYVWWIWIQCLNFLWIHWIICEHLVFFVNFLKLRVNHNYPQPTDFLSYNY